MRYTLIPGLVASFLALSSLAIAQAHDEPEPADPGAVTSICEPDEVVSSVMIEFADASNPPGTEGSIDSAEAVVDSALVPGTSDDYSYDEQTEAQPDGSVSKETVVTDADGEETAVLGLEGSDELGWNVTSVVTCHG